MAEKLESWWPLDWIPSRNQGYKVAYPRAHPVVTRIVVNTATPPTGARFERAKNTPPLGSDGVCANPLRGGYVRVFSTPETDLLTIRSVLLSLASRLP